jgi:glycosyltransferase involved in cell wall biosynthesis
METGRITVALVINDFLVGGAQKLLVDLTARLDKERFRPVLITLFRFGEGEEKYLYRALAADAEVHCLSFKSFWDVSSWMRLIRVMRTVDADVVMANLFLTNTVMRLLAPLFRYRVVTVEHNTYTKKTKLHQRIDRLLSSLSVRIVAVSNTVADFTAKQEGITREKFTVIHNGIDAAALGARARHADVSRIRGELGLGGHERVFMSIARVVPQKNPQLLIDGFALFREAHPEYRLVMVGGGSHLEKMRAYAASKGLTDSVFFLGYRSDVPELLSVAYAFVSTSAIEGFGIGHAEALACGVPVLTTKTAGPDEMITEGKNGFFITAYTPEAVCDGMERMHAADRTILSKEASESVAAFSIDATVAAYEELFASAVRG